MYNIYIYIIYNYIYTTMYIYIYLYLLLLLLLFLLQYYYYYYYYYIHNMHIAATRTEGPTDRQAGRQTVLDLTKTLRLNSNHSLFEFTVIRKPPSSRKQASLQRRIWSRESLWVCKRQVFIRKTNKGIPANEKCVPLAWHSPCISSMLSVTCCSWPFF